MQEHASSQARSRSWIIGGLPSDNARIWRTSASGRDPSHAALTVAKRPSARFPELETAAMDIPCPRSRNSRSLNLRQRPLQRLTLLLDVLVSIVLLASG